MKYQYTSNAWAYVRSECRDPMQLASRIIKCGFHGYDLFVGHDSQPALPVETSHSQFTSIRQAAEDAGGVIASLVLVGFDLAEPERCRRELLSVSTLTRLLGTRTVHLLPRKSGITQHEGFNRLQSIWQQVSSPLLDQGILVTAENHAIAADPDSDLFLIRRAADFDRLLEITHAQIKLKYDCSWFWWADEDPHPNLTRLVPHLANLDLKDSRKGCFVTPGTGLVDFQQIKSTLAQTSIRVLPVEIEHHQFQQPEITKAEEIDHLQRQWLHWYQNIFE